MESRCVQSDGYDQDLFKQILSHESSLKPALERAQRLLQHPESFLHDLFALLFKLNVELRDRSDLLPSVLLNRRLVRAVLSSEGIEELRAKTALHEQASAAALVSMPIT